MATLYEHPFTEADGTKWTEGNVCFDKVLGTTSVAGSVATVSSNKGIGPTTANESIYRSQYIDALRDYKVSLSMKWNNAAGTGRAGGPGVRVSSDGKSGYFAILDSNLGVCRIRLVRRNNGVFTDLGGGWVVTSEGAAALNAGVTVSLRVQTQDDGVHLKVMVGSSVYFDYVDPSVAGVSIEDGGTAGIYHDGNCTTVDITFDDLVAKDFEDEATSGTGWQTGIAIIVNGVYYNESEWREAGLDPISARVSYAPVAAGAIADLNDAGSPFLHVGDWVKILYNNVALCEGQIQTARQEWPPPEGIVYEILSPRQLGDQTLIEDPDTRAPFVSFNFEPDSEFYNEDRADFTVGDVFKWLYDNHTKGDGGLRDVKAAPASGDAYVTADFAALDAKIPNLTISGNVLQAEETLLSFMPEYAIYTDPATRVRRIHKRSTAPTTTLKTSEGHRVPVLTRDTSKNFTRIIVYGTVPDAEDETFLFDPTNPNSTLIPYWDRSLEGKWTPEKAKAPKSTFDVIGAGIEPPSDPDNPNFLYLTVDPGATSMDAHEWAGTILVLLTGPDAGSTYTVRDNTAGGKVWLKAFAWTGGQPNVGDDGYMSGIDSPDNKRNGHDAAFKEFDLGGAKAYGPCANALVRNRVGTKTITVKVKAKTFKIRNDDGSTRDGVRLDLPALGLINRLGTLCGTDGGGGAVPADEVEITVPTTTTQQVPRIVVPDPGFRGTAYSFDPTRWNGGGQPAPGDPACKRTLPLNFPDFQSVALQGAEYTKMADAMLAVYGTLSLSGTFALNEALTTSWVGLNKRLFFVDDGDDGLHPRATGYETAGDLWLLQVEFNLRDETTILSIGTLSAQGVDLDAYRKRYAERTRLDQLRRYRRLAQELRDCLKDAFNGAGAAGDGGSGTVSGCNVTSDFPGVPMTDRVSDFWEIWLEFWEWFSDLILTQKGIDVANMSPAEIQDAIDAAATAGFGGIEGAVAAAVMVNKGALEGLHFQGFSWSGGVAYPLFSDGANPPTLFRINPETGAFESFVGGAWVNGTPVYGGVLGGILANLGKTIDNATGLVAAPGSVLGASGGTYYRPGAAPVSLGAGATVPGGLSGAVLANKAFLEGLTLSAGGVFVDALGYQYRLNPNGTITSLTGGMGPALGGVLGGILANLGKTVAALTGAVLTPGTLVPAGGAIRYRNGALPEQLPEDSTVPPSTVTQVESLKKMVSGLTPTSGANVTVPSNQGGSVYAPNTAFGFTKVSGSGLAGPSVGGMLGALAGKCGSTFDGAGNPGSGPGSLLAPGATVGAAGAYYYPPTERADQPDVVQLAQNNLAPASSTRTLHAALRALGLSVTTLSDKGGPVYTNGTNLYRVDASERRLRRVDSVTAGTGDNGGDYSWHSPTEYFAPAASDDGTFLKLLGRAGGQEANGGTAASENLDLSSTTHATKGRVRSKDDFETQKAVFANIGVIADVSADQNDWDLDADGRCSIAEIGATAAGVDITGIINGAEGRRLTIRNRGSTYSITFKHQNTGSSASNRIITADGGDLILAPGQSIDLHYVAGSTNRWYVETAPAGSGYLLRGVTRYTSGSGTYNTPAGVRAIRVRCWGGGGGGGGVSGAASQSAGAGSGAAGGFVDKWIASPSSSYSYAVGGGGAGGSAGANNGNAGTETTFGTSLLTAAAGGGGNGMAAGTTAADAPGGAGGTGSGGDINIVGGDGGYGFRVSANFSWSTAGAPALGGMGGGGVGLRNAAGLAATGYGAGGGGAATLGATDRAGGNGSGGLIEIEEYY